MSISAKSAASTPPAPERIVMTASRLSYSPLSRVRTSSSPTAFFRLASSVSASAMVAASPSSVPGWTSTSSSSMRWSIPVTRSSSELARDNRLVTSCAVLGSSHRSGAPDCSSSSMICTRSESRSVTCRTDSMVARRSLSTSPKSTATRSQTTRPLPQPGACPRLGGDRHRTAESCHDRRDDQDVNGDPTAADLRLTVRAAWAIGPYRRKDTVRSGLNGEVARGPTDVPIRVPAVTFALVQPFRIGLRGEGARESSRLCAHRESAGPSAPASVPCPPRPTPPTPGDLSDSRTRRARDGPTTEKHSLPLALTRHVDIPLLRDGPTLRSRRWNGPGTASQIMDGPKERDGSAGRQKEYDQSRSRCPRRSPRDGCLTACGSVQQLGHG